MSAFASTFPQFAAVVRHSDGNNETVFEGPDPEDAYEAFLNVSAFVGYGIEGAFYVCDEVPLSVVTKPARVTVLG